MNLGIKRKRTLSEFTVKEYGVNGVFMAMLFLFGLFLSGQLSTFAIFLYVLLWVASYFIIHAATCRNCVYHGKQCPVPLEGSCSHLTFDRGHHFGIFAGVGGLVSYFLRVRIPYVAIFQSGSILYFISYTGIIAVFFYILFYHTGCPNCVNTKCPLNPDFSA